MAKTFLDQLVEYPGAILKRISEDKTCVSLLLNKPITEIIEDDYEKVLGENIFDYQYVDSTTEQSTAYVWVEIEVDSVDNRQMKGVKLYITIACHKAYMKLKGNIYKGMSGNRRDNLTRFIDKLLNNSFFVGIGALSLKSVRTLSTINGFTAREIVYRIPDFNVVELDE